MARTEPVDVSDLAALAQVGEKVTDAEWLAAHERARTVAQHATVLGELEAHRRQGEQHRARLKALKDAEAAKVAFEAETLEPLRDAYASYVGGRAVLTRLLDDYWERWRPLATACDAVGIPRPPELNKFGYMHLADMEALGTGVVEPHDLHRPRKG